jgi:hypothetical protein
LSDIMNHAQQLPASLLFQQPARCAFPARRWGNSTRASVSGRLRQGPKTVSLGAEIIHRVTAADRGFKEIAPELE